MSNLRIRMGGLLRCCIDTLYAMHDDGTLDAADEAGARCRWCPGEMRFVDGAWEWAQP